MQKVLICLLIIIYPTITIASELKKCSLHDNQITKPIKTSTGNVFVLKNGKWQIAKNHYNPLK